MTTLARLLLWTARTLGMRLGFLTISRELALAGLLANELLSLRVRIDVRTAHDSYGAWRDGAHDDMVLATAIACWCGEQAISALARTKLAAVEAQSFDWVQISPF